MFIADLMAGSKSLILCETSITPTPFFLSILTALSGCSFRMLTIFPRLIVRPRLGKEEKGTQIMSVACPEGFEPS
jgi:hypothetical protein